MAKFMFLLQRYVKRRLTAHVWRKLHNLELVIFADVKIDRLLGGFGQVDELCLSRGVGEGFQVQLLGSKHAVPDTSGDLHVVNWLGILARDGEQSRAASQIGRASCRERVLRLV